MPSTLTRLDIADALTNEAPPVEWLVPDLLPRSTLIALAGMAGAGKSFFCYTLSIALATGTTFLKHPLTPKRVLYFDQENSRPDAVQYLRWAWQGLDRPQLEQVATNFFLAPFVLGLKDWVGTATRYVHDFKPDLIIIDTTTPAFSIEDENDNGEATKAIGGLRTLQSLITPAPTILALKHAKLDSSSGRYTLRGAKAWEGAVDGVIFHMKVAGRPREDGLTNTALRPAKTRAFGLRDTLTLRPEWVLDGAGTRVGIRLKASVLSPGGK